VLTLRDCAESLLLEIARSTTTHVDQVYITLIRAMKHYKYTQFWFNEKIGTVMKINKSQIEYRRIGSSYNNQEVTEGFPADFLGPKALFIRKELDDTPTYEDHRYQLFPKDLDWIREYNYTSDTTLVRPGWYTFQGDVLLVAGVPDANYELRLDYLKDLNIPYYRFQDSTWKFYTPDDTNLNPDTFTNEWLEYAEELIRQRAKWDIYMSLYDDEDKAAKAKTIELDALRQLRHGSNLYNAKIGQRPSEL
jgi:hypothetical protein